MKTTIVVGLAVVTLFAGMLALAVEQPKAIPMRDAMRVFMR